MLVHRETNAYFHVCERRELISPKLNWFRSASVNSEIIILSCNLLSAPMQRKPGPVPLMRCIVRDPAATDANVDPTTRTRGRTCTRVRTHPYLRIGAEVYGRGGGKKKPRGEDSRMLVRRNWIHVWDVDIRGSPGGAASRTSFTLKISLVRALARHDRVTGTRVRVCVCVRAGKDKVRRKIWRERTRRRDSPFPGSLLGRVRNSENFGALRNIPARDERAALPMADRRDV